MDDVIQVFDLVKKFRVTPENAVEIADKISNYLKQRLINTGMDGYVLGLSGGLDSAVAAYLCKRAGVELYVLMMPYGQTMASTGSAVRAGLVITELGLEDKSILIDIKPECDRADKRRMEYAKRFPSNHPEAERNLRLASENRRARQRMIELFDFAQPHRLLVLGTDNLDEHCLGYFTEHGDAASHIEPLQYCLKGEVRTIARAIGVPEAIITCAPSAELSPDQTDEGDLGFSYDAFDAFALNGTSGSDEIDKKIVWRWIASQRKRMFPPAFNG